MNTHRTDGVSLTFGLIFLGVVAWWLFGWEIAIGLPRFGWLVAAGLIVLGLLGLLRALRSDRRGELDERPDEPL